MKRALQNGLTVLAILGLGFLIGLVIFGGAGDDSAKLELAVEQNEVLETDLANAVKRSNMLLTEITTLKETPVIVVEEEAEGAIDMIEDIVAISERPAVTYTTKDAEWNWSLKSSTSKNVFRNLTKVSYMDGLNATFVKAPQDAIGGKLVVTLDVDGVAYSAYPMHTWNVTVGYTDCKIAGVLDRNSFPAKRIVDLSELNCTKGIVNVMEDLKNGARIAIYHAMDNGISYDGQIDFYK